MFTAEIFGGKMNLKNRRGQPMAEGAPKNNFEEKRDRRKTL